MFCLDPPTTESPDCAFLVNGVPIEHLSSGQRWVQFLGGFLGGLNALQKEGEYTWAPQFLDSPELLTPVEERIRVLDVLAGFVTKGLFDQSIVVGNPDSPIAAVRGLRSVTVL